jgi:prolyl-tRNA editing enzyme YbaK/EbsC (Cys-tRNA(Pro) deacylase)
MANPGGVSTPSRRPRQTPHMVGTLDWIPAPYHPELMAPPVAAALEALGDEAASVSVAEIDPDLADTAAFCTKYDVGLDVSANCVVVAAKRGSDRRMAACVVLATTRADVNGLVRRQLEAKKVSFASMDAAVEETGMEYGGITPIGLPAAWPLLVDASVVATDRVVVGSGVRLSKLLVPGALVGRFPGADVLTGLGVPVEPG